MPKESEGEGERWTSLLLIEDRPESAVCIVFLILKMSPPTQATQTKLSDPLPALIRLTMSIARSSLYKEPSHWVGQWSLVGIWDTLK